MALSLMVHYRMKYRAETRELENDSYPPPRFPDQIVIDDPEVDLSGDDEDYSTPKYYGNDEVIFEHI